MTRHPDFWTLPSSRRFVKQLRAGDRGAIVVQEPFDVHGLVRALEKSIRDEGLDEVCVIDAGETRARSLAAVLADTFGERATTPEGFALAIDYTVLIVVGAESEGALRADLCRFAAAAAGRSGGIGPAVIMVSRVPDARCKAPAWTSLSTHGVMGPLDGVSFAAQTGERHDSLAVRVSTAVAVEVGAWDLEIVERLQSLPLASAIRPDLHVERWADDRLERWRGVDKADWPSGSHDQWGGEPYIHPLFLAANRPVLLAKRVWRGQVAVLFPWLEERRQEVVQTHRKQLRPDASSYQDDVDTLDWGPICRQLEKSSARLVEYLQAARLLRNQLAHGRPASWDGIQACLRMATERIGARSPSA